MYHSNLFSLLIVCSRDIVSQFSIRLGDERRILLFMQKTLKYSISTFIHYSFYGIWKKPKEEKTQVGKKPKRKKTEEKKKQ